MGYRRLTSALASLGLGVGLLTGAPAALAATRAPSPAIVQGSSPAARPANLAGATPSTTPIDFDVGLKLSDPAGAVALEQAVSEPTSASYRQYLTPAQWESRFSPSQSSVNAVASWLRSEGIAVAAASPDRMTMRASASAATVSRAFGTTLGEYREQGRVVRLAARALKVPSSVASLIVGVSGIDQTVATPDSPSVEIPPLTPAPGTAIPASSPLPPPSGVLSAPPCSAYYAKRTDTTDPAYGDGFPGALPYAPCGYVPAQLQGAYGLSSQIARGIDGKGVTVAVVDAYASPTLFKDARQYSRENQSTQVLAPSQFSEILNEPFKEVSLCEGSRWLAEQTLDVEAVHATAPGANILYVGAENCEAGLYAAVQQVVDGHLAQIITDSWGDEGGDRFDSAGLRQSFDNILLMAGGTGVGVLFSAGDNGDEFKTFGRDAADFPPSSPYVTAVGGTSLLVGLGDLRDGEFGWSTSRSVLCTETLQVEHEYEGCTTPLLGSWLPPGPGAYFNGGGGGTSEQYPEPSYQEGVVPAALADRNMASTHVANRVEPDLSMDADPSTGMLVGETQVFPNGTYYGQSRRGGTSLSSPLFAGVLADADQAGGTALGFVNPLLYKLAASRSTAPRAFYDIVPHGEQALARVDYLDGVDAKEGSVTSVRVLDYQGPEEYCAEPSKPSSCTTQMVSLNTGPGFNSMTGIGSPGSSLVADMARP